MLQNATPLRKSALWPRNISDEHVSCTATATENASLQILLKCPRPADAFETATKPSRFAHFGQGAEPLAPATQNDTSTSKSGANMWCSVHFDFEMLAATACTFWTSQLPKVVRTCQFLTLLTSKCASHHNGVQLFISHLARWLSEPTFRPCGATNHWKNTVNRGFPTFFARLHLLSSDSFSSLIFSSLTLPTSAFPSLHIVGSLTSKLPSIS